jgi:membrane protease YdiL (CAAX protease family)
MGTEDFRYSEPPEGISSHPMPPAPVPPDQPAPVLLLPERPPHPGFWFSLLWCIGFLITQVAVQIAVFILLFLIMLAFDPMARDRLVEASRQGKSSRQIEQMMNAQVPEALSMGFQEVTGIAFAWILIRFFAGTAWKRRIALAAPAPIHFTLAVLALPGTMILSGILHTLVKQVIPGFDYAGMVMDMIKKFPVWFSVMCFAVGPAISEELMLRGFVGRGLVARYGVGVGILLTSFLFGLLHLDPPHVAATMALGAVLHWVYFNSRSILLPMMMHFVNNGIAVLSVMNVQPFDSADDDMHLKDWPIYGAALLLLATSCWALYVSRKRVVAPEGGWRPSFPGVELPPPTSTACVERRTLDWGSGIAVIVALATFVAVAQFMSGK